MSGLIVADTGPLIALARIDRLPLLRDLYRRLIVPPAVVVELRLDDDRPGARALRRALMDNWLERGEAIPNRDRERLELLVDPGEAEAILLAERRRARFLLIDERRGRRVARRRGVPVVGTGGVLLVAKEAGLIDRVAPILEALGEAGYYLAAALRDEVLRLANE